MSIKMRYFSVEEAEKLIPRIKEIFLAALQTKGHIEKKIDEWRKKHRNLGPAEEAVLRGQVDFLATRLEEQLAEVTELGCIPKDLDLGLVDFPARINDKEGYLCWKLDEEKIMFWHGITEGFQGRKPLPSTDEKNEHQHDR